MRVAAVTAVLVLLLSPCWESVDHWDHIRRPRSQDTVVTLCVAAAAFSSGLWLRRSLAAMARLSIDCGSTALFYPATYGLNSVTLLRVSTPAVSPSGPMRV